ncbi:MAG: hypothetical protein H7Z42_11990 [Roseiflexaceae bacterium]|nr:hypothetical protein [Roseiflexaceae bacterium]
MDNQLDTPEKILADWLAGMDAALDYFAMQTGLQLDYTAASLDRLEAWLLDRYPNPAAIESVSEQDYLEAAARFVGETFRHHAGGSWELLLDEPSNIHNGIPRLNRLADNGPPIAPQLDIITSLARRQGSFLRMRLQKRSHTASATV